MTEISREFSEGGNAYCFGTHSGAQPPIREIQISSRKDTVTSAVSRDASIRFAYQLVGRQMPAVIESSGFKIGEHMYDSAALADIGRTVIEAHESRGEELTGGQKLWKKIDDLKRIGSEQNPTPDSPASIHDYRYFISRENGGVLETSDYLDDSTIHVRFFKPGYKERDEPVMEFVVSPFFNAPLLLKTPVEIDGYQRQVDRPVTSAQQLTQLAEEIDDFSITAEPGGVVRAREAQVRNVIDQHRDTATQLVDEWLADDAESLPVGLEGDASRLREIKDRQGPLMDAIAEADQQIRALYAEKDSIDRELLRMQKKVAIKLSGIDDQASAQKYLDRFEMLPAVPIEEDY